MLGTTQDHDAAAGGHHAPHLAHQTAMEAKSGPRPPVSVMAVLSFAPLAAGLAIAFSFGPG
jgi:hypothetical protein